MDNLYESEKLLGEYLLFHYGQDDEVMPWSDGPQNGLRVNHFEVHLTTALPHRLVHNGTTNILPTTFRTRIDYPYKFRQFLQLSQQFEQIVFSSWDIKSCIWGNIGYKFLVPVPDLPFLFFE